MRCNVIIVTRWGEPRGTIFLQCFDTVAWVFSPVKTLTMRDNMDGSMQVFAPLGHSLLILPNGSMSSYKNNANCTIGKCCVWYLVQMKLSVNAERQTYQHETRPRRLMLMCRPIRNRPRPEWIQCWTAILNTAAPVPARRRRWRGTCRARVMAPLRPQCRLCRRRQWCRQDCRLRAAEMRRLCRGWSCTSRHLPSV